MQWMRTAVYQVGLAWLLVFLAVCHAQVRGDLIRSNPARSFPGIAGDIVGSQTYRYDPDTQTGTFEVVNAPALSHPRAVSQRHVPHAAGAGRDT